MPTAKRIANLGVNLEGWVSCVFYTVHIRPTPKVNHIVLDKHTYENIAFAPKQQIEYKPTTKGAVI